ncbi:MAG: hypothetical protein K9G58_05770 [Bacteroidales bacterium]|nr:hypothetical protein [Bacteroidales bacterium]MCF8387161.1 hypothetical protein [Bacteroidales bacterium]MCF8397653.1 hypothetical protein [Bacteroidales bacterium]
MEEIIVVIAFVIWYALSLVISETMGKSRKIGVEWSFFISFVFSPLIGLFVTLLSDKARK